MKQLAALTLTAVLLSMAAFAQTPPPSRRRPAKVDEGAPPPAPDTQYYSILTGQPKGLVQHHDHKKGTNKPLIVDVLTLEVQVMNSDGYFEPIGLQILNFYTAKPQDAENDIYPFGAHDCRIWAYKVAEEENLPQPVMGTWSYGQSGGVMTWNVGACAIDSRHSELSPRWDSARTAPIPSKS